MREDVSLNDKTADRYKCIFTDENADASTSRRAELIPVSAAIRALGFDEGKVVDVTMLQQCRRGFRHTMSP